MSASKLALGLAVAGILATWSCSRRSPSPIATSSAVSSSIPPREAEAPRTSPPVPGAVQLELPTAEKPAPASLPLRPFPDDIVLHRPHDVAIPGDRDLRVSHAPGDKLGAVIYLPGMCGNPKGADPWVDLVTAHATVITVRGNVKCPDRPGYKWPQEPSEIQPRIEAALAHVLELRAGHLETHDVTLIGYSQGAHRGEKLAAAYPDRYRVLVLGGPPTPPDPKLLAHATSVAILGGELEDTTHMVEGFTSLREAGIQSRFFVLPGAHHGSYGPEGRRVMQEVLDFSFGLSGDHRQLRSEIPASH